MTSYKNWSAVQMIQPAMIVRLKKPMAQMITLNITSNLHGI
jgi:hypothetical protein